MSNGIKINEKVPAGLSSGATLWGIKLLIMTLLHGSLTDTRGPKLAETNEKVMNSLLTVLVVRHNIGDLQNLIH